MKKIINRIPKTAVLYLLFSLFIIIAVSQKINYYIDEIYSYGLSNYVGDGIDMEIEYNKTYEPGMSVFSKYMEVQEGQQFYYADVWKNQTNDVHPPLYYAILHTVCSLFPDTFSMWYAASINILFLLMTFYFMRKLIVLLTDKKYILTLISLSFVTLGGIIQTATYFRMYCMTMCWVTLLTWLIVCQVEEKQNWKFYVSICMTTILGALTHYYFIVYAFFLACTYGIYLLHYRRYKEAFGFCVSMGAAAGIAIGIFPAMIQHMFYGYRGTEAIANLQQRKNYWECLKTMFDEMNRQLFGNVFGYLLMVSAIVIVILFLQKNTDIFKDDGLKEILLQWDGKKKIQYTMIFVPCICYFFMVSKMSFIAADRYIWPIYAVAFSGVLCLCFSAMAQLWKNTTFIMLSAVLSAMIIFGSFSSCGWTYLYKEYQTMEQVVDNHKDYDCICVVEGKTYQLYPEFAEYSQYKSITFVTPEYMERNGIEQWKDRDGLVVSMIANMEDNEAVIRQMQKKYNYTDFEYLGTFGYDNTYFLYR